MSARVPAFGGQKIKHTGDGYLLAFTGPTLAIECAEALAGRESAGAGFADRHTLESAGGATMI
ncbi:hypothetical protein PYH37_004942 [Sinorhizobium numidicum]|uniref:Adenylate/guanylate cyclase domain-containing protein n=1 Tax=Sinorhizobium numidicum TaxID=680248 RepID=A0ABY8CXA2_9HYPH|nr:hypothetical protein [Sinorhizobium numidicum]WEX76622.1 hypothetical protein PYH37_004942 [Sinorhizobium numidicum]WEX83283.1 hypothetical protein PYH38_005654 [Sinorhizobium numidicum]